MTTLNITDSMDQPQNPGPHVAASSAVIETHQAQRLPLTLEIGSQIRNVPDKACAFAVSGQTDMTLVTFDVNATHPWPAIAGAILEDLVSPSLDLEVILVFLSNNNAQGLKAGWLENMHKYLPPKAVLHTCPFLLLPDYQIPMGDPVMFMVGTQVPGRPQIATTGKRWSIEYKKKT